MGSAPKKWLYYYAGRPAYRDAALVIAIVGLCFFLTAPGAAEAKQSVGGSLSGMTSQGMPGNLRVSSSGLTIKQASISVQVNCAFGPMILPQTLKSVPVTPGGRFKATGEATDVDEGITVRLTQTFSGKFNPDRTKVTTKSRIYVHLSAPDGSSEECDSGVVTMHAS